MMNTCQGCLRDGVNTIYYLHIGKWVCSQCYEPRDISIVGNLHIKRKLYRNQVSLSRIAALKRRVISKEDGHTVIDSASGKSVTKTGIGYK